MKINKTKLTAVSLPLLLGMTTADAVPLPGGTLDPLTIPKYVTPLVIPPVMNNTGVANEYDIAVRQFQQQILPAGLPSTTVWSYGPAADPTPSLAPDPNSQFNYPAYTIENLKDVGTTVNWINDLVDANGNALPHLFAVDQTLHWANPLADCSTGEVRTDCHGTTDQPYLGPVPMVTHVHGTHVSGDSDGYTETWWLPDATNITCVPRNADGTVPVGKTGYDANANHWNVVCEGTIANLLTDRTGKVSENTNVIQGEANYVYQNDQPSTTLWYHDHSLGMTRINVYAGPAGFWLVRDPAGVGGETGLGTGSILPGPAPVAGEDPNFIVADRDKVREIPMVIQDRSFNNDGSLFYPDNRAFFEGLNVAGTAGTGTEQFPGAPELQINFDQDSDLNALPSDIAPIWNPEAFFNTMVVNGVVWPKLEVAPAQYRFRLLNGANSRFLNLALKVTDPAGNPITVRKTIWVPRLFGPNRGQLHTITLPVRELDFYQIGSDQSLLPQVVAVRTGFATQLRGRLLRNINQWTRTVLLPKPAPDRQQALLVAPAERTDVIVDFRGLPDGTIITMTNTAPDTPFGGFPDIPADPSTTGQVMQYVVNHALLGASPTDELRDPVTGEVLNPQTTASNVEDLSFTPIDGNTVDVTNPFPRQLALVEEESALVCADVDVAGNVIQLDELPVAGVCPTATALPFAPKAAVLGTVDAAGTPTVTLWSEPIVTNIASNDAEQWDIWNFTIDGHPIHVHQVKFEVLSRAAIGGGPSVISDWRNRNNGVQTWENGWKDMVIAYPGEITSIAAEFDINGLYVWHCHIVEHEDNEMMVPFCVGGSESQGGVCPDQLF